MNIIWYGNHKGMYRGWWDMTILEDFFKNEQHFEGMEHFESFLTDVKEAGAVVIIPARTLVGEEQKVSQDLQVLKWCVLIVAGDEEAGFDIDAIHHPHMTVWVQYPKPGKHDAYKRFGCGYTTDLEKVKFAPIPKSIDWFFAGQITHSRRELMAQELRDLPNGDLLETAGFAQGVDHITYLGKMADAKVAPCPAGPETPDTFRLFEALELGCVPIADEKTPKADLTGFWNWVFGEEVPFLTTTEYIMLPELIQHAVNNYPVLNNTIQAWWMRKKIEIREAMYQDAYDLGARPTGDDVTIVVPVSPIKSHPDTGILEETIDHIRFHFPTAKIIITFDGVRPEQEHLREAYNEHIRRLLWISHRWGNIYPMIFETHTHQVEMMRQALKHVITPMVIYNEQDTPLVTDEPIDWHYLKAMIMQGESNLIRFHFEAHIPKAHSHLMVGPKVDRLQATVQWSQRPHLALTAFYRQILNAHFSTDARCFIEDRLHGKVQDDYNMYGMYGWSIWKMHIYVPNETNIKRSYHTDGRAQETKYDGEQIW